MNTLRTLLQNVLPAPLLRSVARCGNPACSTTFLAGRRGSLQVDNRWFCSSGCCLPTLKESLSAQQFQSIKEHSHRIPLGLALLASHTISTEQLRSAVALQHKTTGRRIGECLEDVAGISERVVSAAVAAQWGCASFTNVARVEQRALQVPLELLKAHEMFPVHWNARRQMLHVGFVSEVDRCAADALGRVLRCQTDVCILPKRAYEDAIASLSLKTETVQFSNTSSTEERAEIVVAYARQTGAVDVRIGRTSKLFWLRLSPEPIIDLLFPAR